MSKEKVDLTKMKQLSREEKDMVKPGTFEPAVMSVRGGKDPINQVTNSIIECYLGDPPGSTFVTSCC